MFDFLNKVREYFDVWRDNIILKNELNKEKIATKVFLMNYGEIHNLLKKQAAQYDTLVIALALSGNGTFELSQEFVDAANQDMELQPKADFKDDKFIFTVTKVKND